METFGVERKGEGRGRSSFGATNVGTKSGNIIVSFFCAPMRVLCVRSDRCKCTPAKKEGTRGEEITTATVRTMSPIRFSVPKKSCQKSSSDFCLLPFSFSLIPPSRFFYQGEVFDREQRVNLGTPKGGKGEGLDLARSQGEKWQWKNLSGLEWGL